jgi:hypothetical protein
MRKCMPDISLARHSSPVWRFHRQRCKLVSKTIMYATYTHTCSNTQLCKRMKSHRYTACIMYVPILPTCIGRCCCTTWIRLWGLIGTKLHA